MMRHFGQGTATDEANAYLRLGENFVLEHYGPYLGQHTNLIQRFKV